MQSFNMKFVILPIDIIKSIIILCVVNATANYLISIILAHATKNKIG